MCGAVPFFVVLCGVVWCLVVWCGAGWFCAVCVVMFSDAVCFMCSILSHWVVLLMLCCVSMVEVGLPYFLLYCTMFSC